MMMRRFLYNGLCLLLMGLLLPACHSDIVEKPIPGNVTLTIDTHEDHWTYVNMENGVVKGTSELGDTIADRQWAARQDWDVAFCKDMIRTNGGTSGEGAGALQLLDQPYDSLEVAPSDGYDVDTIVTL